MSGILHFEDALQRRSPILNASGPYFEVRKHLSEARAVRVPTQHGDLPIVTHPMRGMAPNSGYFGAWNHHTISGLAPE